MLIEYKVVYLSTLYQAANSRRRPYTNRQTVRHSGVLKEPFGKKNNAAVWNFRPLQNITQLRVVFMPGSNQSLAKTFSASVRSADARNR